MLDRMAAQLSALRDADQFRDLKIPAGIQLNSNDYLALSTHPLLKLAVQRAIEEDARLASTGSRLLSGHHERWDQLETEFAEFLGVEASLYFPSGYTANIGLLSSVLKPEDTVFSDAANHASLIDGARLARAKKVVFPHLDLHYLENALRRETGNGQKIIVVESIFSMDGDHAPLAELLGLCERFGSFLIVDEAHSTGVEGAAGRGSAYLAGRSERILATVHTCGKALASMGAFVAGSRTLRDFLINQARPFIFTTGVPPYCAAQVRQALALVRDAEAERSHLRNLSDYLRAQMRAAGFDVKGSTSQIIPLILGSNEAAVRFAMAVSDAGFAVRAIRPPTVPPGSSRLRLSLNAGLTMTDINALVNALTAARDAEVVSG
jgi:8-amino-7-oxononanoate synthase